MNQVGAEQFHFPGLSLWSDILMFILPMELERKNTLFIWEQRKKGYLRR